VREQERQRVLQREKELILSPIWAKMRPGSLAELFGGDDAGRDVAAFVMEVQRELPLDTLTGKLGSKIIKPDQTG